MCTFIFKMSSGAIQIYLHNDLTEPRGALKLVQHILYDGNRIFIEHRDLFQFSIVHADTATKVFLH